MNRSFFVEKSICASYKASSELKCYCTLLPGVLIVEHLSRLFFLHASTRSADCTYILTVAEGWRIDLNVFQWHSNT